MQLVGHFSSCDIPGNSRQLVGYTCSNDNLLLGYSRQLVRHSSSYGILEYSGQLVGHISSYLDKVPILRLSDADGIASLRCRCITNRCSVSQAVI